MDRGVVFQDFTGVPWRTALGNVTFGLEMKGMAKHQREPIAWEQLRPVKLEKFVTSYPDDHSLAYNPEVLLMGMKYGAGAFRAGHSTNMVQ